MLVCAFVSDGVGDIKLGRELVLKAYNEAIKERYRFYSYGDCMLII
jgi:S-adenosylmethionine:tRNA-ribosyltransferase-isomerase (queuine synthetase)